MKHPHSAVSMGILLVLLLSNVPVNDGAASNSRSSEIESGFWIAEKDIEYLNRLFRERSTELAFCGFVDERRLRPVMADTVRANQSWISFRMDNCREYDVAGRLRAIIHTQPNGADSLSKRDKATLSKSFVSLMCLQSGPIATDDAEKIEELRCFREKGSGVKEVRIQS